MASRRSMALGMVGALGMVVGCGELQTGAPSGDRRTTAEGALVSSADGAYAEKVELNFSTPLPLPIPIPSKLSMDAAVGAPNEISALIPGTPLGNLLVDFGEAGGQGNLKLHLQGVTVGANVEVKFMRQDKTVITTTTVPFVVSPDSSVEEVSMSNGESYRYVQMKCLVCLFGLDAVEATPGL